MWCFRIDSVFEREVVEVDDLELSVIHSLPDFDTGLAFVDHPSGAAIERLPHDGTDGLSPGLGNRFVEFWRNLLPECSASDFSGLTNDFGLRLLSTVRLTPSQKLFQIVKLLRSHSSRRLQAIECIGCTNRFVQIVKNH